MIIIAIYRDIKQGQVVKDDITYEGGLCALKYGS